MNPEFNPDEQEVDDTLRALVAGIVANLPDGLGFGLVVYKGRGTEAVGTAAFMSNAPREEVLPVVRELADRMELEDGEQGVGPRMQ